LGRKSCAAGASSVQPCTILGRKKNNSSNASSDRHACVHSIVPIYQLSLEVCNALAEQILIDFSSRLKQNPVPLNGTLAQDLKILANAAGHQENHDSIEKVLEAFSVEQQG
jgi:hypothetical protein